MKNNKMIEIFCKKTGLQAGIMVRWVYFAPGIIPSTAKRDIDVYLQCSIPIEGAEPCWTVSADLAQDEDVLFQRLNQTYRRQIRRAVDKDGLVAELNFTPTDEDIDSFKSFFNVFSASRGLAKANVPLMKTFRDANCLSLASVRRDGDNLPLAMLSFVSDGYRARQYTGATSPRVGEDSALIGRANKLLVWETILAMKNAGLEVYDFGGISRKKELKGIDDYKRMFGGVESEEYNALVGVSSLGKLAVKTSELLDRFNFNKVEKT